MIKYIEKIAFVIGCFLIILVTPLIAQTKKIDSLFAKFNTINVDTVVIDNLLDQIESISKQGEFDEGLKASILIRRHSEKINFRRGIAKSLQTSGITYKLKGAYQAAISDLVEAEVIYYELNDKAGLGQVNTYLGQTYDALSESAKALEHYLIALDYFKNANKRDGVAFTYISIGMNYYRRGSYKIALDYYRRSLYLADSIGSTRHKAVTLNNLGVVYEALYDYKKALIYYSKALPLLQQEKLLPFVAKVFSNIGGNYIMLGNFEDAKINLDKAYRLRIEIGDKHQVYTLSNYGDLYRNLKMYDSAENYYERSLKSANEMSVLEGLLYPINGLCKLYLSTGRLDKANNELAKAYAIALKVNSRPWIKEIYKLKAKIDSAKGNYKSSFEWYKRYDHLHDSLYHFMMEEEISFLENENQNEKLRQQSSGTKKEYWSLTKIELLGTIVCLLVIVSAFFIFILLKNINIIKTK